MCYLGEPIIVTMVVLGGVASTSITIPMLIKLEDNYPNSIQLIMIVLVSIVFGIPFFVALFLLVPCSLVCFSANVIQYCTYLLHDAPTEDSILLVYIH